MASVQIQQSIIPNPLTVSFNTSIAKAIALMQAAAKTAGSAGGSDGFQHMRASCVLVIEDTQLVGVFTERDVVRLWATGESFCDRPIAAEMTPTHITLPLAALSDVSAVAHLMQQQHLPYLPVVDSSHRVVGLLTPSTLLAACEGGDGTSQPQWPSLASDIAQQVYANTQLPLTDLSVACPRLPSATPTGQNAKTTLGSILNRSNIAIASFYLFSDYTWQYNYFSAGCESVFGFTAAEMMQDIWWSRICPEDQQTVVQPSQTKLIAGEPSLMEYRFLHKDGHWRWIRSRLTSYWEEDLGGWHVIAADDDITDRKQTELALQERDRQLSTLISNLPGVVYRCQNDASWSLEFASQSIKTLTGYSAEDFVQQRIPYRNCIHPEDWPTIQQQVETALAHQTAFQITYRIFHASGEQKWVWEQGQGVFAETGEFLAIEGLILDITQQKQTAIELQQLNQALEERIARRTAALLESEYLYRFLAENATDMISRHAADGTIVYVSPACETLLQYHPAELLGKCYGDFWHPDDLDLFERSRLELLSQPNLRIVTYRAMRKDGQVVWLESTVQQITDRRIGDLPEILAVSRDITARKQIEEKLSKSETHLRLAQRIAGLGSWELDLQSWQITWTQEVFRIFGRSLQLGPPTYEELIQYIHPDDRDRHSRVVEQAIEQQQNFEAEFRLHRPDGRLTYLNARGEIIVNREGQRVALVGTVLDITERKQIEAQLRQVNLELTHFNAALEEQVEQRTQQLQQRILYDELTHLPSRSFLLQHIQQAILDCQQGVCSQFALLYLDCDQFKLINSSLGHEVGDRLLVAIRDRLRSCLLPTDLLARVGEDEFCILRPALPCPAAAESLALHCLSAFSAPFLIGEYDMFVTACIGVAVSSPDYQRPQDILRDADTAMYKAKAKGKGCHQIFDQVMRRSTVQRLTLENDLQRALDREEFCVYYQPIIHLASQAVWGFEALVRWQHPTRGLVAPNEFIPCLEETGLIVPAGRQILRQACQQLQRWQQQGWNTLKLSANLSVRQFAHPLLLEEIDQVLAETGLDPDQLKLEITESAIMDNPESAITLIRELRSRQIQISIDDFGTGYSSLSYLQQLPVDSLKIDRSFINRIDQADKNSEIVQAINNLGHTLGMNVIAEGIETAAQLSHLQQLGCEYGQGFFFAKPLSNDAASRFLRQH
ncbi:EAL domain-containing protein [Almyronema epifaneia]|uniref:EAL domain-containing protein n=1 Tax=Almyronema epifaneia S1 TaxID=2991925 RepID=A0ABW6IA14_9CYAN